MPPFCRKRDHVHMRVVTLASSSKGNCTLVSNGNRHLLIDAGISLKRIGAALALLGVGILDIEGVLVTHEHSDHISGLNMLSKYCGTPVYASGGTADAVVRCAPNVRSLSVFEPGDVFELGGMEIGTFKTSHDAAESTGFTLRAGRAGMAYVTDLGCITKEVADAAGGLDLVLLEANYDPDMLINGRYPDFLKKRILGRRGHLSNIDCASAAVSMIGERTRRIVLAHLSIENNFPDLAVETVRGVLKRAGVDVDSGVLVSASPRFDMGMEYII